VCAITIAIGGVRASRADGAGHGCLVGLQGSGQLWQAGAEGMGKPRLLLEQPSSVMRNMANRRSAEGFGGHLW